MTTILRPGNRVHTIPGIGVSVLSRRAVASAAAAGWWLAGGAPTPIAAYQPKGAASLAASYVNLSNPGTYDAAPGTAPTLDASGWVFNGSSQYLNSGVTPANDQTWTALVRYSDATEVSGTSMPFGGSAGFEFGALWTAGGDLMRHGAGVGFSLVSVAVQTSGVLGFAGRQGYFNGAAGGVQGASTGSTAASIFIGTRNNYGGPGAQWFAGKVQAFVIWNTSIGHATWMPAVSAAMAAL